MEGDLCNRFGKRINTKTRNERNEDGRFPILEDYQMESIAKRSARGFA